MNTPIKLLLVTLLLAGLSGCSSWVSPYRTQPRALQGQTYLSDRDCESLLTKSDLYLTTSGGFGAAAGGYGLATAVLDKSSHRYIAGSISLGMGIVSIVSTILLKTAQIEFSKGCMLVPATP